MTLVCWYRLFPFVIYDMIFYDPSGATASSLAQRINHITSMHHYSSDGQDTIASTDTNILPYLLSSLQYIRQQHVLLLKEHVALDDRGSVSLRMNARGSLPGGTPLHPKDPTPNRPDLPEQTHALLNVLSRQFEDRLNLLQLAEACQRCG
jgi:hypothetical protein